MERIPVPASPEVEVSIESRETLRVLRTYVQDGYLLHGGKARLTVVEPRQAHDSRPERITGKQFAVHAADNVEAPIFMALKDKKDPQNPSVSSGYSGTNGKWRMWGNNVTLTPGYVHVLPRDTFEFEDDGSGDGDWISRVPVVPVATLWVQPEIFKLFNNIEFDLH